MTRDSTRITSLILTSQLEQKIHFIRGHKVMLAHDLAELYGVQTKSLNLAVKRNLKRFPEDFMFLLTRQETANLRLQIETSNSRQEDAAICPMPSANKKSPCFPAFYTANEL